MSLNSAKYTPRDRKCQPSICEKMILQNKKIIPQSIEKFVAIGYSISRTMMFGWGSLHPFALQHRFYPFSLKICFCKKESR